MWLGASGNERTSDPIFPSARSVVGAELPLLKRGESVRSARLADLFVPC